MCVCVLSIVAKHYLQDEFPPSNVDRFVELAREGWKHSIELDRLMKLYPEECGNQTNTDGVWSML
jgi:hypothetical protein